MRDEIVDRLLHSVEDFPVVLGIDTRVIVIAVNGELDVVDTLLSCDVG